MVAHSYSSATTHCCCTKDCCIAAHSCCTTHCCATHRCTKHKAAVCVAPAQHKHGGLRHSPVARTGARACMPCTKPVAEASLCTAGSLCTPSRAQTTSKAAVKRSPRMKSSPCCAAHSSRTCGGVRKEAHQLMRVPPPTPLPARTGMPARRRDVDALRSTRRTGANLVATSRGVPQGSCASFQSSLDLSACLAGPKHASPPRRTRVRRDEVLLALVR